jgi:hypothetical protein
LNFKAYPRRKDFIKFSRELFDFIDHHPIGRVVVDMRQNGGGDFTKGREYIVSEFKKRPRLTRRGMLYVIMGRWTYSAGMANAADFRNDLHAFLVGEPTGARPNGYQENRAFSLPNSHLGVSYSTQLYKFQEQDTPGIIPDKRIDPDWRSYQQGRDPALAWILKQAKPVATIKEGSVTEPRRIGAATGLPRADIDLVCTQMAASPPPSAQRLRLSGNLFLIDLEAAPPAFGRH